MHHLLVAIALVSNLYLPRKSGLWVPSRELLELPKSELVRAQLLPHEARGIRAGALRHRARSGGGGGGDGTEPVDPGSGYLFSDGYDQYASAQAMVTDGSSCGPGTPGFGLPNAHSTYGQMTEWGLNFIDETCDLVGTAITRRSRTRTDYKLISPGRNGAGKAIRVSVSGTGVEGPEYYVRAPANPNDYGAYSGAFVQQYYWRLSSGAPAGAIGYKWDQFWYAGNASRIEMSVINGGGNASFCLNSGLAGNSNGYALQYQAPYWDHGPGQLNDATWHRQTCLFLRNTSYNYPSASSRDGKFQVWIDGTRIIDVSSAGVTAGRCTTDDLDRVPPYQVKWCELVSTLNDPTADFDVDLDDYKVWTV